METWKIEGNPNNAYTFAMLIFIFENCITCIIPWGRAVAGFAWSSIAQSVCEWAFSLLAIWCLRLPNFESCIQQSKTSCLLSIRKSLAARSYRSQDGADAAARLDKFLPAHVSLWLPIYLKFATEKHKEMVHLAPKRQTGIFPRYSTIITDNSPRDDGRRRAGTTVAGHRMTAVAWPTTTVAGGSGG